MRLDSDGYYVCSYCEFCSMDREEVLDHEDFDHEENNNLNLSIYGFNI